MTQKEYKITKDGDFCTVKVSDGSTYYVDLAVPSCSCDDFYYRKRKNNKLCKHITWCKHIKN